MGHREHWQECMKNIHLIQSLIELVRGTASPPFNKKTRRMSGFLWAILFHVKQRFNPSSALTQHPWFHKHKRKQRRLK